MLCRDVLEILAAGNGSHDVRRLAALIVIMSVSNVLKKFCSKRNALMFVGAKQTTGGWIIQPISYVV